MRFAYGYKTEKNETRFGEIRAASRDDAYRLLKGRGIRPFKVELARGLFNQFLGRRLRPMLYILSACVVVIAVVLSVSLWRTRRPFVPSAAFAALERDARKIASSCATNCAQSRLELRQLFADRFDKLSSDPRERDRAKLLYGELSLDIDVFEDQALLVRP